MKRRIGMTLVLLALTLVAGLALTQNDTQNDAQAGDAGAVAGLASYLEATVFPGSVLISQNTETEFESSASLQEVYSYVHDTLTKYDWQRTNLTENESEIEAEYARDDASLSIDLELEGSDRYDLETSFDD